MPSHVTRRKHHLIFTFDGHLTLEVATDLIETWKVVQASALRPLVHVWEASKMTGYDKEARILWQDTLSKYKGRIGSIYLISDRQVIRLGARVISIVTGIKVRPARTYREVP